ncbi:IS91 family transposase [Nitrincola tibetensis]
MLKSCWKTLHVMGQRKLHGQLGMTAVLHKWGQKLTRHVHLHCLIPAGVITSSQSWIDRNKGYLLPVKALSKRFRGLLVSALRETKVNGGFSSICTDDFDRVLRQLMNKPWCVYSKAAIQYRETLVNYLARYSHRIGLSNHRLLESPPNRVTLAYHDYRAARNGKLHLTPEELVRRFLLHVLPKGFMRIRLYGFLSNAIKRRCLLLIREQLGQELKVESDQVEQVVSSSHAHCPSCGHEPVTCLGEYSSESMTLHNEASLALLNSS